VDLTPSWRTGKPASLLRRLLPNLPRAFLCATAGFETPAAECWAGLSERNSRKYRIYPLGETPAARCTSPAVAAPYGLLHGS
jgi:hypothetical protein